MNNRLSLRARLLLAVGAITLVALSLVDVVVYGSLRSYLYGQVDNSLEASHHSVEATADNPAIVTGNGRGGFVPTGPPPGSPPEHPTNNTPDFGSSAFCAVGRESAPGMYIEILNKNHSIVTGAAGREECPAFQPGSVAYAPKLPSVIAGFTSNSADPNEPTTYFTVRSTAPNGPAFRVRASQLRNGGTLVIAAPIANLTSTLAQLLIVELAVTGAALLAAIVLGLWLVRIGLRPLRDIERTAEAISDGALMHRVPNEQQRTEVGHVARAFNVMLERIETLVTDLRASESRLRRFVSDASHELRTPIAAISAYAQLFEGGITSSGEELDRVMHGIERETGRMTNLVEDLLTLAKLDEHRPLELEPIELVGLAIEAAETSVLVGPFWPVEYRAVEAVEVLGDRPALRQVLDNLLANVRAHTPKGTHTTIDVKAIGNEAILEVTDDGPGITEEQARLVFERFFRVEVSRSRAHGGAGLGLAIVQSIVEAHGGQVRAVRVPTGGTAFRVTLPKLDGELGPSEPDSE